MGKIITWFKSTGISNLVYLGIGIAAAIFNFSYIAGAALGIFCYINFNVIYKMIFDKVTVTRTELDKLATEKALEMAAKSTRKTYSRKKK